MCIHNAMWALPHILFLWIRIYRLAKMQRETHALLLLQCHYIQGSRAG